MGATCDIEQETVGAVACDAGCETAAPQPQLHEGLLVSDGIRLFDGDPRRQGTGVHQTHPRH